ncbi:asparagine synthase-related protein [uncultured Arcticibacterium sp.]|uniref:asparagine synthase-related protein n=1 Tax=uncultured Arcticibacterium sp. TaxID=2173042 RepID=UPI0030FADEAA
MSKYLHIQQFNAPLTHPDLQPMLRKLGYTLLNNGQAFQQFGQKPKVVDRAKENWLLDIYPEKDFFSIDNLDEIEAEFSGLYFHKMKFSVDLFRDVFGVKSLYYYFKDDLLIASNELRAILACLPKMPAINNSEIAAYFDGDSDNEFVREDTFFENIKRILPGQRLHFRAGKIESSFFWKANFERTEEPEELVKRFSERLQNITIQRTENQQKIAANLSGGLDSSSLCSIISQQSKVNLKGIFFDSQSSASFEKKYAQEVAEAGKFQLSEVVLKEDLYASIRKITRLTCKPESMIIPSAIFLPIMNAAALHGSKVLVSGHGGDSTVGYGHAYIKDLISSFKFKKLREVLFKKWLLKDEDDAEPFEEYLLQQVFSHSKDSKVFLTLKMLLSAQFSYALLWQKIKSNLKTKENEIPSILAGFDFEKSKPSALGAYYQNIKNAHHYNYFKYSLVGLGTQAMETLDALGRQYNLVSTYPFLDRELLSLAANVPPEINFQNGYLRGTLRDAMKGILPESVRLRTRKAAFNDFAYESFHKLEEACRPIFTDQHLLWEYVNKTTYEFHLSKIKNENIPLNEKGADLWISFKVIYLGIWLNEFYTS